MKINKCKYCGKNTYNENSVVLLLTSLTIFIFFVTMKLIGKDASDYILETILGISITLIIYSIINIKRNEICEKCNDLEIEIEKEEHLKEIIKEQDEFYKKRELKKQKIKENLLKQKKEIKKCKR